MWIHISTFQPPIFLINNSNFVVFCVFVRRYFSGTLRCTLPVTEHSSLWNNESGECSHDRDYWKNDLKKFGLWTGFEPTTFYVTGAMLYQLSYKSHVRAPCVGSALDSYSTGIRLVRAAGIFSAVLFMFWLVFPAVVDVRLSTMLINITLLLSLYVICTSHLLMHCRQRLDGPIFDMHSNSMKSGAKYKTVINPARQKMEDLTNIWMNVHGFHDFDEF